MQRQRLLQEALNYCQHNQFNEAKAIYLDLIKTLPNHPQILTNLGTIDIQFGFIQQGIDLLKRSLKIDPWQSHAISNLGNGLLELNQHKEAIEFFDRAISISPKNADSYYNKGRALRELGNLEDAIICYSKAIEFNPKHFLAMNNRGFIYNVLKKYDLALNDFDSALKINSNYAEAYTNKGASLSGLGKHKESVDCFIIAIQINPHYAEAFTKLGISLNTCREYEKAIEVFNNAISCDPNALEAYNGRGLSFFYLRQYDEAGADFDKSLFLNSDFYEAINNKGLVFLQKKVYSAALELFNKGIKLKPNKSASFINKAQVLIELGQYDSALIEFNEAIKVKPDSVEAYYNSALLYLNIKNFKKGWDFYEKRIETEKYLGDALYKDKNRELKDINVVNKAILIHNEQGLGDQILYLSLIRELDFKNNKIIVLVNPRLIDLFKRCYPEMDFLSKETTVVGSVKYDYHLLSASLGKFLRKSELDFHEQPRGYLKSNQGLTKKLKNEFASTKKVTCGIAWKSKNEDVGIEKSLALEDLLPILKIKDIRFVDLQYGETKNERDLVLQKYDISINKIEEIDNFNDIDGLASLIDACDFILTTSNVTAHIAGALGKNVYLIVPSARGKIWYWHEGDTKSLWYPTINQFNLPKNENAEPTINKIADKIRDDYL